MICKVSFSQEKDGLVCKLGKNEVSSFDLFTVIGDFISIKVTYTDKEGIERIKFNYDEHIFTKIGEDTPTLNALYYDEDYYNDVQSAFETLDILLKVVSIKRKNISDTMFLLDGLKNGLKLKYTYQIDLTDKAENDLSEVSYTEMTSFTELKDKYSWIDYTCYSISDIVASVIHYCALYGYTFTKCKHCEKWFATKNLKNQYCNRISPMTQYSQKDFEAKACEPMVNTVRTYLSRQRKKISNKYRNSVDYELKKKEFIDEFNDFWEKCENYKSLNVKSPTVTNLLKYFNYLKNVEENVKGWVK